MSLQPLPYPWERQPDEGDKAWNAFQLYRDLPLGERSLSRVASALIEAGQRQGKTSTVRTHLGEWSVTHDWVERAAMWDRELDRRKREEFARESAQMGRRQATQAQALIADLMQPAEALVRRLNDPARAIELRTYLDNLPFAELFGLIERTARVFPSLIQAERLARGQSGAIVEVGMPERGPGDPQETLEDRLGGVLAALEEAGVDLPSVLGLPREIASQNGEPE